MPLRASWVNALDAGASPASTIALPLRFFTKLGLPNLAPRSEFN